MTLQKILDRIIQLDIKEKRTISEEYIEIVFLNKDSGAFHKIFTDLLGPPEKPQGAKPSKESLNITKDYGGIRANQIFFKNRFGENTIIAMFWPWQDDIHTTLKVAIIRH